MPLPTKREASGCFNACDQLAWCEWAVHCVTGEDVEVVGGADADNNFMTLSDTSSCGKLTALAKLLHLWYHEGTANKVWYDIAHASLLSAQQACLACSCSL